MNSEDVLNLVNPLENSHNIKIIYAALGGSRFCGYDNDNSDWDIIFIYHHPIEKYLSLDYLVDNEIFGFGENIPDGLNGIELRSFLRNLHTGCSGIFGYHIFQYNPVYIPLKYIDELNTDIGTYYNQRNDFYGQLNFIKEVNYNKYSYKTLDKYLIHSMISIIRLLWCINENKVSPFNIDILKSYLYTIYPESEIEFEQLLFSIRNNNGFTYDSIMHRNKFSTLYTIIDSTYEFMSLFDISTLNNSNKSDINHLNNIFINIINDDTK